MSIQAIEEDDDDRVPRVFREGDIGSRFERQFSGRPPSESFCLRVRKSRETAMLQAIVLLEDALSRRNAEVCILLLFLFLLFYI